MLVLAPADGAAWVRAALVRDLVCAPAAPAAHLLAAGMLRPARLPQALQLPPPQPLRLLPTQLPRLAHHWQRPNTLF